MVDYPPREVVIVLKQRRLRVDRDRVRVLDCPVAAILLKLGMW